MAEPFIGEVRIMPYTYAPSGWAFCDGSLLQIQQYTALFSVIGITYGGDGRQSFGLPDLAGRAPLHPGQGAGLSSYSLGQLSGQAQVTLDASQLPAHRHDVTGDATDASERAPVSGYPAQGYDPNARPRFRNKALYSDGATPVALSDEMVAASGGGQAHENRQPFLAVNFCIALTGLYPPRP